MPPEIIEYTLILPEADALALVLDEVPLSVKIAILSGMKAMHEPLADFATKSRPTRSRKARTEAA
jgi:hypothetical protein